VTLSVGHRTCDLQVAGLSPGQALRRDGHRRAIYTCVSLSPSSITWYWPKGVTPRGWEDNVTNPAVNLIHH